MMINTILKTATIGLATFGALHAQQKPNIIYILADDLGYGDLGCYGQQKIETPHIDQLAREGIRFTQHYSGSPVSAPSRAILLTGKHSGHAYIRGNDEMRERGEVWSHQAMLADSMLEGQRPLPAGTITFPKLLQQAGYATAMVGKWGLGYPGSEGTPNKMGFDFFYGYNCQRQAHTYYPPFLYRNENREYLKNKLLPPHTPLDEGADPMLESSYDKYTQQQYSPDLMLAEIKSFVTQNKNNPFLLTWTTPVPHVPLQAPQKWIDYYVEKFGDEKPYLGESGYFPARYPHAAYAAMISYFDEQVGELIAQLKELDIYNNTLIIFTSDNGPSFNGGTDSPWFESANPFKSEFGWGKTSLREGGIRVPMITVWQGKIKAGTSSDHISAFWDVMPTFAEIAGVKHFQSDGISFLPTLLGKKQRKHKYLYWEFPENEGSKAIRMGKWKGYIGNYKKGNRKMELYDLSKDPREQNNIADKNPRIVHKLHKKMEEAHEMPIIEKFEM
jgi:arylsulfatase A-like enzyme